MSIPPLQVVEPLDAVFGHCSSGGLSAGTDIARLVQSAAPAAGCPIAILYLQEGRGFRSVAAHGLDAAETTPAGQRFLAEAAHLCPDGLLTARDASCRPGDDPEAPHVCVAGVPAARFVAGIRIADEAGRRCGVLVVADRLPHAAPDAVRIALLRAHAAELSSRMEPSPRQAAIRQLRRFEAVAANANEAVPVGRTRPGGFPRSQVIRDMRPATPAGPKTIPGMAAPPVPWEPIEIRLLNAANDGTEFWDALNIVPVSNGDGCYTHWVSAPDRAAELPSVRPMASGLPGGPGFLDRLGFMDRPGFMDRLGDVLGRCAGNTDLSCVVLLIEPRRLDRADESQASRDFLQNEQARRLKACIRPQDMLARSGSGEFALLIEGFDGMTFMPAVAMRIIEALSRPLRFGNGEIQLSCSIGMVHVAGRHADGHQASGCHDGAELMMQDAGSALQQAKRSGTGSHAVYTMPASIDIIPLFFGNIDPSSSLSS